MSVGDTTPETTLREAAAGEIDRLADQLATQFVPTFQATLLTVPPEVGKRLKDALSRAGKFKWKATVEKDTAKAREYAEAVETALRSVRLILTSEALVKTQDSTDAIMAGVKTALGFMVDAGAKILGVAVQQFAAGAVQGLVGGSGGGGGNPSGFPR